MSFETITDPLIRGELVVVLLLVAVWIGADLGRGRR